MVSFLDLDPLEEHIGFSVSQMNDSRLFGYCELYFLMTFEHSLKDDTGMAYSRIKWLRGMYDRQTGDILKWVWFRYGGWRDGEKFSFSWFSQKQVGYTRRLQGEMAGHRVALLKKLTSPDPTFTVSGFMTRSNLTLPTTSQIVSGGGHSVSQEQISHG